jgi:3-methyl-2-oxobutanoate hydroxymethyltransferase
MSEINRRASLVTVSPGSGADADVIFLFTSDICGEAARLPRHARA